MEEAVSIAEFIRAIQSLPSDQPRAQPGVWYTTQKQHWLGWLRQYDGLGAYGRIPGQNRYAKFTYNHVVCPKMLLWLIEAGGVKPDPVNAARAACVMGTTMMQKSGAIRRHVPWAELQKVLWCSDRKQRAES